MVLDACIFLFLLDSTHKNATFESMSNVQQKLFGCTYHNLLAFYLGLEPYIADQHDQDSHSCNKKDGNHLKLETSLDKFWNNLSTEREEYWYVD